MKRTALRVFVALFLSCGDTWLTAGGTALAQPVSPPLILVVLDGLRADYITPAIMPRLHELGRQGLVAERHHSVFPTVTRVNSASIATGAYPGAHGLMHNKLYLPAVAVRPLDTTDFEPLSDADKKTGGQLLTAVSLGEVMAKNGRRLLVAASASTGTSFLLNHKRVADGIWNSRGLVVSETNQTRAIELLGPFPGAAMPSRERNRWAVRAALEHARQPGPPDVIALWLTDPDHTAHAHGIGSPKTLDALRHVDGEIGFLLDGLSEGGLRERINLFVTADHGFSSNIGGFGINKPLADRGLEKGVNFVGNQLFVKDRDPEHIRRIVRALQQTDGAGAIFTRAAEPGAAQGFVPGTLSFDLIRWQHARSADILVTPDWTDKTNAFGFPGASMTSGKAGHGNASPWDLQIRLIASGPAFKRGVRSSVPTCNVDIAPTVLHLLGLSAPPTMQGRVLKELLRDGPAPEKVAVRETIERAAATVEDVRYELELVKLVVGDSEYLHSTKVRRERSMNDPTRSK